MATLVSAIATRVQRIFPDFSDTTLHAEYANKVHREVVFQVPLRVTTRDIAFTTAQEYALQDTEVRIWSVELYTSATSHRPLTETSVEYLNIRQRGWRSRPTSNTTSMYYVWSNTTGRVIGLVPAPASAASGGYPLVRLYVSQADVLTTASNIPAGLLTDDLYTYGMAARYAEDEHRDQMDLWLGRYYDALEREYQFCVGKAAQDKPQIIPGWLPSGGIV